MNASFFTHSTTNRSSGLVVASRLSEDPSVNVLVLEAGSNVENLPEVSFPKQTILTIRAFTKTGFLQHNILGLYSRTYWCWSSVYLTELGIQDCTTEEYEWEELGCERREGFRRKHNQ